MEARIDFYPTHEHEGQRIRHGKPFPFGATLVPGGVNFSIFSRHATSCTLVLFKKGAPEPFIEIPFRDAYRIGNVFCMVVFDLDVENIDYGYRLDGPFDPRRGHRFDKSKVVLDPYAKAVGGRSEWGVPPDWANIFPYRGRIAYEDFDWEDDCPPDIPLKDLVIYEIHVRGFTRHESSKIKHPGTYAGIAEKIPYLKELGINCVELMPVYEFDEFDGSRQHPNTGETLFNYWGYSTVGFFTPKAGYAASGRYSMQVDEFKNHVKLLHLNGIEVILDVVFNHTAEGNENGPTISFRGVDNQTYYMLTPDGYYFNFSGCGNTLNCNNPIVRSMVLDCLRYWVSEYRIDGFRFDLAAILSRDQWGAPMPNPPLLESLAFDPVLGRCKLIAEAWDAGGLYEVGTFPAYGRWTEWNGKYRDDVRRFIKGDEDMTFALAQRLQGSPDLYGINGRGPTASINFITCHDGFTLRDLFSYNDKHNEANGEENRDGGNDNHSWNCGEEGETNNTDIIALRGRQTKNALAILMLSHGVPMLLMGDEIGRTQGGNNNAYCHDTEMNWLDWTLLEKNAGLFRFAKLIIAFRQSQQILRIREFLYERFPGPSNFPPISWHGVRAWNADYSKGSRTLACMFYDEQSDSAVYIALNSYWDALPFELPQPPGGLLWHIVANTYMASPEDIFPIGHEPVLADQNQFLVGSRSVVVLLAKRAS